MVRPTSSARRRDRASRREFVSELLMGSRLRCANCHNHPLDRWTQDDYHGLAAIFAKIEANRIVQPAPGGEVIHPRTLEPAAARIPGEQFLAGGQDGREQFADWLTGAENPYFAKAMVNRLWKHMFGRGLVSPVDDFRATNPATHPELLDLLADDFAAGGYRLRRTLRLVARSATYQRSSDALAANRDDDRFYSHAYRRPLESEVLADAVTDVLGAAERYGDQPLGTRAVALVNPRTPSRTLDVLGRCAREDSCESGSGRRGRPAAATASSQRGDAQRPHRPSDGEIGRAAVRRRRADGDRRRVLPRRAWPRADGAGTSTLAQRACEHGGAGGAAGLPGRLHLGAAYVPRVRHEPLTPARAGEQAPVRGRAGKQVMSSMRRCDGATRRDAIRVGGVAALGLGLGDYFRLRGAQAAESGPPVRAQSCILVWLDGGPSHLETFDPKPDAPQEVRGPLETVTTSVPGVAFSECLEQTAQAAGHLAVIRSMTSPLGEHNFGTHYLMTGYRPTPALDYPTFGATIAQARSGDGVLPPNIAVPSFSDNVSGAGFLPAATAPFAVGGKPDGGEFRVRDLDFYRGIDLDRLDRRRRIVHALDDFSQAKDAGGGIVSDPHLERAYRLIASAEAKQAFDLSDEPDSLRNRYGRGGGGGVGQSCLLARRLVERGVPFVTVNSVGWDSHQNIVNLKERYPGDRGAHLPALDRALSALLGDLNDRGMLEETLVVVMGEFGRTPKLNAAAGRDHWPNVFSVALAGGGVRGGQVVGASDSLGEYPADHAVTPADLAATIYTLMGVDPASELRTSDGRPVRVAPDGATVISQLLV